MSLCRTKEKIYFLVFLAYFDSFVSAAMPTLMIIHALTLCVYYHKRERPRMNTWGLMLKSLHMRTVVTELVFAKCFCSSSNGFSCTNSACALFEPEAVGSARTVSCLARS